VQPQHLAHFAALAFITRAAGESFQARRGGGMRLDQSPAGNFRPETIEEFDDSLKVVIHQCLNARMRDSCKEFIVSGSRVQTRTASSAALLHCAVMVGHQRSSTQPRRKPNFFRFADEFLQFGTTRAFKA
jgi:hypothetical protein